MTNRLDPRDDAEISSTNSLFNGVRLTTRVMPARHATAGGDWCETFSISESVVALSIGDVCGHGVEQFESMCAMRQAVRDAALCGLDPAYALAAANRVICDLDPQLHATAVLALLDVRQETMTFANAGHPPPLVVGTAGPRFLTYGATDLPLGIERKLQPALRIENLRANSLLVLYTDGVTERDRQPLQGESRLRKAANFAFKYAAPPTASVIEELMFLTGSNHDDASILTAWMPRALLVRDTAPVRQRRYRRLRARALPISAPFKATSPKRRS